MSTNVSGWVKCQMSNVRLGQTHFWWTQQLELSTGAENTHGESSTLRIRWRWWWWWWWCWWWSQWGMIWHFFTFQLSLSWMFEDHCDFMPLRNLVLAHHMQDLKDVCTIIIHHHHHHHRHYHHDNHHNKRDKGSLHVPIVQFFYTLFKRHLKKNSTK